MTRPRLTTKMAYRAIATILLAFALFAAGRLSGGRTRESRHDHSEASVATPAKPTAWTCSMHPQIQLPKAGQCPICFMDLIPLMADDDDGGLRELSVSETSARLMELETTDVQRRFVSTAVRMVGKIEYDETRVSYITAWVPGRLDRLFVDYTGIPVRKGDHLVSLYSPELLGAQEELLQAVKAAKALEGSNVPVVRDRTEATVVAVREKLRLWGLTAAQIAELETRGKADDHVTIYAPSGGIVIHKNAQEGMYVNTGTRIYTIADLSRVWVNLDAYESDLQWLRYGQTVAFTTESYPGETFAGTVSFIHPVLDEATRTVKVRVNVPNENGRLKPGMFVRAVAEATVATGGRVMDTDLAGKWISPMHPEVVKDAPGECDVCGMPLVRAESLGYVGSEPTDDDKPLVIPATAPLLTGTRAVVYVEVPGMERPTYEGREIVLGPRAGDYYVVAQGLAEGERVVTKGGFKLDAELQIRAKPSMMSPADSGQEAGGSGEHADHAMAQARSIDPEFSKQLGVVTRHYLAVQTALAGDDASKAIGAAQAGLKALAAVDMGLVQGDDHAAWMKHAGELKAVFESLSKAAGIEPARAQFALLSDAIMAVLGRFGVGEGRLYKAWCPMAFDNRGASWIQDSEEISNPYFGDMMLRCGEIKEVLE